MEYEKKIKLVKKWKNSVMNILSKVSAKIVQGLIIV